MEKYTDTDIINDVIDYLSQLQNRPFMTIIEMETSTEAGGRVMHTGMKFYASSQYIKDNKMIRTLQATDLDGDYLGVDVKNILELHVDWDHEKHIIPDSLLKNPLLKKVRFTAPPQRKVTWGK